MAWAARVCRAASAASAANAAIDHVRDWVAGADGLRWLQPTERWQETALPLPGAAPLSVDENFYVEARSVTGAEGS